MYVFTHCQKYTDKIDWTIQLSPVAQLVEQSAVNRLVASSSLAGGAQLLSTKRSATIVNARDCFSSLRAFFFFTLGGVAVYNIWAVSKRSQKVFESSSGFD